MSASGSLMPMRRRADVCLSRRKTPSFAPDGYPDALSGTLSQFCTQALAYADDMPERPHPYQAAVIGLPIKGGMPLPCPSQIHAVRHKGTPHTLHQYPALFGVLPQIHRYGYSYALSPPFLVSFPDLEAIIASDTIYPPSGTPYVSTGWAKRLLLFLPVRIIIS